MQTFKRLLPTILMILFEIFAGVMLITNGEGFTKVIFIVFGSLTLVGGIITLLLGLFGKATGGLQTMAIIAGLIMVAVGGFFAAASDSVLSVVSSFSLAVGIIMVIEGFFKIFEYVSFRRFSPISGVAVLSGVITIIIGIIFAFNPFAATEAMWVILGVLVLVTALSDLIALIFIGSAMNKIDSNNQ